MSCMAATSTNFAVAYSIRKMQMSLRLLKPLLKKPGTTVSGAAMALDWANTLGMPVTEKLSHSRKETRGVFQYI